MRKLSLVLLALTWSAACLAADEPIVIPYLTDPTPIVDGSLQEWANRGVLRELNRPEQVVFNRNAWKDLADLSGWVRLGYNDQNLFVACHVVDDVVTQEQSGIEVWKGDHIMLNLDFVRSGRPEDMWRVGLSPGSLKAPDAAGPDVKPEMVIWLRPGFTFEGAVVAARRTTEGYDLEAAIPWKIFNVTPIKDQVFGIQMAFSDCDTRPNVQGKVMALNTVPWGTTDTTKLIPAGLGDRSGQMPPDAFLGAIKLAKSFTLKQNETREFTVEVKEVPEGRIPTLTFKARVPYPTAGGCAGPLLTLINGKSITADNLADRPAEMLATSGMYLSAWYAAGVRLWLGPSSEVIEKSGYKPMDVVACDYVLRLDNLFHTGKNTISFKDVDERPEITVLMEDLAFSWSPPSRFQAAKELKPAPTGPLTTIEPWATRKVDYKVAVLPGGALKVSWAGRDLIVRSRFSKPDGGWAELTAEKATGWDQTNQSAIATNGMEKFAFGGSLGSLQLIRTYIPYDECILVRDTLVNTSKDTDRPIIITHQADSGTVEALWLGGRPIPSKNGAAAVPSNPSVVVLGKESGFGLMPRDDVFRIHSRQSCDGKVARLDDDRLVLRPGVTYLHEWLIVPLPTGDYWHFVNAARRYFKTNFAIEGCFYFFHMGTPVAKTLDEIKWSGAHFVSFSPQDTYKGYFAHGPIMRSMDQSKVIAEEKALKAVSPQTKRLNYFNCFNYSLPHQLEDPGFMKECQVLGPDGKQISDGYSYTFYFPTLSNAWGKDMDVQVDWMLNTIGADGLYQDCYDYWDVTHYGEPWDGWTADIDPTTHRLTRKKSSLTLISWPWRERLTARLLKEGRPIVANGNPTLTSEYQYHFPRFVETADISALSQTALFTPIALGDSITERNEVDAYRWMLRALDWGALYYWYDIVPTRTAFTAYMFPFTPIELHSGYILGEERILTKVSGSFGWGDMSGFKAHVFDRLGKETDEIKVPRAERDGKAYAEVRIPEGYAAAIVRER